MQGVLGVKKDINLSLYHRVLIAARSKNVHLIPKAKPLFGIDPALCGVKPLMLGWAPLAVTEAESTGSSAFLCEGCRREASQ